MIPAHSVIELLVNRPLFAHPSTAMVVFNTFMERQGLPHAPVPMGEDYAAIHSHLLAMPSREMISRGGRTIVRGSIDASRFEGDMVQAEDGSWRGIEPFMRTKQGTAIVSITGSLVNRGAYVGAQSGVTSYEGIIHQIQRVGKDPKSQNLVLDISTPGGEAMGNTEVGDAVRKLAAEKPVYAIVNSMCCSAGYAIASNASEVISTPSGLSGSIGCIMLHLDATKKAEMEGLIPTLITAGDHKADGHPLVSMTPDALAELRGGVNSFYELFVKVVAAGRGSRLTAKMARDTQARTYIGRQAKDAGLVDDIGTFSEVLAAAEKQASRLGRTSASKGKGPMSILSAELDNQQQPAPQQQAPTPPAPVQQPAPVPQQAGFDPRVSAIMDHATIAANPTLMRPALDLARQAVGMSADAIVAFVSSNVQAPAPAQQQAPVAQPQQGLPQQQPTVNLQQRADQSGVQQVAGAGGQPQAQPGGTVSNAPGSVTAEAAPWGVHVKKVNGERTSNFKESHIGA